MQQLHEVLGRRHRIPLHGTFDFILDLEHFSSYQKADLACSAFVTVAFITQAPPAAPGPRPRHHRHHLDSAGLHLHPPEHHNGLVHLCQLECYPGQGFDHL